MTQAKKQRPKHSKNAWFVPVRWSYLPASPQGWALYVPYSAYLIGTLIWIYQRNHGQVVFLLELVPYWLAGVIILQWIASHKS